MTTLTTELTTISGSDWGNNWGTQGSSEIGLSVYTASWLSLAKSRLQVLRFLAEGWDSYCAAATDQHSVDKACELLEAIASSFPDIPAPVINVNSNGMIELAWLLPNQEIEVSVNQNDKLDVLSVNRKSDEELEQETTLQEFLLLLDEAV